MKMKKIIVTGMAFLTAMTVFAGCGNSFTMDQVGEISRGCDPWPILDENKTVTDEEIEISYDFLKDSADIFANWKKA